MSQLPEEVWDGNGGTLHAPTAPLRDLVVALHVKVDRLISDVADHETRIRRSEKFRHGIPSIAAISLIVSLVLLYLYATKGGAPS